MQSLHSSQTTNICMMLRYKIKDRLGLLSKNFKVCVVIKGVHKVYKDSVAELVLFLGYREETGDILMWSLGCMCRIC